MVENVISKSEPGTNSFLINRCRINDGGNEWINDMECVSVYVCLCVCVLNSSLSMKIFGTTFSLRCHDFVGGG